MPDSKSDEWETIGFDKVNAEKIELKEAVKRRTLELESKEAKKKVEEALSELKATQSQLVRLGKRASLGQLTARIAHEIKNPRLLLKYQSNSQNDKTIFCSHIYFNRADFPVTGSWFRSP